MSAEESEAPRHIMAGDSVRRVVTARDAQGKSVIVEDGAVPRVARFNTLADQTYVELWSTDSAPSLPGTIPDPTASMTSYVPGPAGTRFGVVVIPPDGMIHQAIAKNGLPAIFQEFSEKLPGLAQASDQTHPGMHTTATVDYDVIVSGEVWLELEDGSAAHLKAGDYVVQQGTCHAWRNRGHEPCVLAYIMIGAQSAAQADPAPRR